MTSVCPSCQEKNNPRFEKCWKCGQGLEQNFNETTIDLARAFKGLSGKKFLIKSRVTPFLNQHDIMDENGNALAYFERDKTSWDSDLYEDDTKVEKICSFSRLYKDSWKYYLGTSYLSRSIFAIEPKDSLEVILQCRFEEWSYWRIADASGQTILEFRTPFLRTIKLFWGSLFDLTVGKTVIGQMKPIFHQGFVVYDLGVNLLDSWTCNFTPRQLLIFMVFFRYILTRSSFADDGWPESRLGKNSDRLIS